MSKEKAFIVDAGVTNLPFPIRAFSRAYPKGQPTVANITAHARVKQEFEARWIDRFIQVLHRHREELGSVNIMGILEDVMRETNASSVEVRFDYPFFIEKLTPVDREKCLVRYMCSLTGRASVVKEKPRIVFKIDAPIITTYPASVPEEPGGLFGQLSIVSVEIESDEPIYPEDLAETVDEYALAPIYSFLTERDQLHIIKKIHSEYKYSVTVVDQIKEALARNRKIKWYAVNCHNYGMLHNYSTLITIEKGMWIPFSTYEEGT